MKLLQFTVNSIAEILSLALYISLALRPWQIVSVNCCSVSNMVMAMAEIEKILCQQNSVMQKVFAYKQLFAVGRAIVVVVVVGFFLLWRGDGQYEFAFEKQTQRFS